MSGPALLLLNGPPGIGKSTLARLLVKSRPLALSLDLDVLRRSLGQWMELHQESGNHARELAVALTETHLRAGHRVVVPQFLGRSGFIGRLERTAAGCGVPFLHVVLTTDEADAATRFLARSTASDATDHHREALAMSGGSEGYARMYAEHRNILATHPEALVVPSVEGDITGTLANVEAALVGRW